MRKKQKSSGSELWELWQKTVFAQAVTREAGYTNKKKKRANKIRKMK